MEKPNEYSPASEAAAGKRKSQERSKPFWRLSLGDVGRLLLDALSFAFAIWVYGWMAIWLHFAPIRRNSFLSLAIYLTVVFLVHGALAAVYDRAANGFGSSPRSPQSHKKRLPLSRRFIFLLTQVILPLTIALLVAMLPISGDTVLTRFIFYLTHRGEYSFLERIDDVILSSTSEDTKIAGIRLLRQVGSDGALDELVKIAERDKASLSRGLVYDALQKAIVCYGGKAEPSLIKLLEANRKPELAQRIDGKDIYEHLFKSRFKNLKDELSTAADGDRKYKALLKAQQLEQQVELGLNDSELDGIETRRVNGSAYFALDTLLKLKEVKNAGAIYTLVYRIASDASYDREMRVLAIIAVAQFGSGRDAETMRGFLDSDSEEFQAAALDGLTIIESRSKGNENSNPEDICKAE